MPSTTYRLNPNGAIPATPDLADVQEIHIGYDPTSGGVTVTPGQVNKGTTVRFKDPAGGKVRIVFLSPEGNPTDTVCDSDSCTMLIGGIYHFLCYFTPLGAETEIPTRTGGVLEVYPPAHDFDPSSYARPEVKRGVGSKSGEDAVAHRDAGAPSIVIDPTTKAILNLYEEMLKSGKVDLLPVPETEHRLAAILERVDRLGSKNISRKDRKTRK